MFLIWLTWFTANSFTRFHSRRLTLVWLLVTAASCSPLLWRTNRPHLHLLVRVCGTRNSVQRECDIRLCPPHYKNWATTSSWISSNAPGRYVAPRLTTVTCSCKAVSFWGSAPLVFDHSITKDNRLLPDGKYACHPQTGRSYVTYREVLDQMSFPWVLFQQQGRGSSP